MYCNLFSFQFHEHINFVGMHKLHNERNELLKNLINVSKYVLLFVYCQMF